MPSKKLIFLLLSIFFVFSFLKLFTITTKESLPSNSCDCTNPTDAAEHPPRRESRVLHPAAEEPISPKEYRLLKDVLSRRAPCNLLFFGLHPQLLSLAALNADGTTVFLDDDVDKARKTRKQQLEGGARVYTVEYRGKAGEAYELLRHARAHSAACAAAASPRESGGCKLAALAALPKAVHEREWDVVVVDGPGGDRPEAPGRMGAIYAAAVIARAGGNVTHVFVHDVDRTIEKWYSWEFLCHENLASSKGKLWHFRLQMERELAQSGRFCPEAAVQIQ